MADFGRVAAGPEDARVRFKVPKVEMTRQLTRGWWSRLDFKEVNEKEEIVSTMEPLTQSCWTSFAFQDNLAVKERGRKAGGKIKENTLSIKYLNHFIENPNRLQTCQVGYNGTGQLDST